jgi:phage baseplate assembly protein gpV
MPFFESIMHRETEQARDRRIYGVVTALVKERRDDGTYELTYLSMAGSQPSAPARAMMPMAGSRRGMHFLPEPGDEVVVAFESGDTNQPIILGAVWNENDIAPSQVNAPPDNNIRSIVSRSGHELTFDDSSGQEKIRIKSRNGHELILDDTALGKVTISSRAGSQVDFDDSTGTLRLSAQSILELSASSLRISVTSMTLSAPGGAVVTTTGSVTASSFVIDGKPFGLHQHVPPVMPPGITGPVAP